MISPHEPDDRDPLTAYAEGDPNAVRSAAPREPTEAEWDGALLRIRAGLIRPQQRSAPRAVWWTLAGAAALAAATVAGLVFDSVSAPKNPPVSAVTEVPAVRSPVRELGALEPHETTPDPLAEFAVLPMARGDEVVLHRVPGDGWLPVGTDPLPGGVALATAAEVELDDVEMVWPNVAPAPGFAPMIFAAKPR